MADGIGWLERTVKMIRDYGLLRVIQAIVVIVSFLYLIYNVSNLDDVFERAFSEKTEQTQRAHDEAIELRRAIKPKVDAILKGVIYQTGSDRAFIIEMHNGTNNTAGLPFIYGEMTYEEVRNGYGHVDDGYVSMNFSRYTFPLYLEKHKLWFGPVDKLMEIDDKLAYKIIGDGVNYIGLIAINGYHNELGVLGVTYCDGHLPPEGFDLANALMLEVQKVSTLLDSPHVDILEEETTQRDGTGKN